MPLYRVKNHTASSFVAAPSLNAAGRLFEMHHGRDVTMIETVGDDATEILTARGRGVSSLTVPKRAVTPILAMTKKTIKRTKKAKRATKTEAAVAKRGADAR